MPDQDVGAVCVGTGDFAAAFVAAQRVGAFGDGLRVTTRHLREHSGDVHAGPFR